MLAGSVQEVELAKWDKLALQEASVAGTLIAHEDFRHYARRSSTMVGVDDFLGDISGKKVLEYGCGLGAISVLLAKSGARVTAFDLSSASVAVAHKRSMSNDVETKVDAVVANGERLPYADESFDVIFGKAILHHLDAKRGCPDLYRVLKKGGKAAFVEPMGINPVLRFVRAYVPYPNKKPRGADRPLDYEEIRQWGERFGESHFREIQLLSMVGRAFGFKQFKILSRLDDVLLKHVPFLRRYCRYVVMFMVKSPVL